ncbi:hypothetical protein EUX98_g513 [Antrodiella citrinella]|uniref:18S rRNA factor 2 n=1 Tax=Antrodiella citrinella TaxID=2447956 RepID=A0A4S4N6K8_9APHY|nr:hypothetical protein EUX98_g513 [Antrodiella citrinella]
MANFTSDSRFALDGQFDTEQPEAGPSRIPKENVPEEEHDQNDSEEEEDTLSEGLAEGMDVEGFAGPSEKAVKPLTKEELAAFKNAQERTGVVYISRIPPGMRPTKVRHLMSGYGEVGRVYLQAEDPKRSYLRKKYTSTKKIHFTEGWVEFKDKKVARSVAEMLNAQPIGGKKGTRWRDDIWTMKYLPKFKWNMLTEQIAQEAAVHAAQLRVELSQSKREQQDYLKNVELARVLDKRAERKCKAGEDQSEEPVAVPSSKKRKAVDVSNGPKKKERPSATMASNSKSNTQELNHVLGSIF